MGDTAYGQIASALWLCAAAGLGLSAFQGGGASYLLYSAIASDKNLSLAMAAIVFGFRFLDDR